MGTVLSRGTKGSDQKFLHDQDSRKKRKSGEGRGHHKRGLGVGWPRQSVHVPIIGLFFCFVFGGCFVSDFLGCGCVFVFVFFFLLLPGVALLKELFLFVPRPAGVGRANLPILGNAGHVCKPRLGETKNGRS